MVATNSDKTVLIGRKTFEKQKGGNAWMTYKLSSCILRGMKKQSQKQIQNMESCVLVWRITDGSVLVFDPDDPNVDMIGWEYGTIIEVTFTDFDEYLEGNHFYNQLYADSVEQKK